MDYEKLKQDFQKIIAYSQDIQASQSDQLIEQWKIAKKDYLDLFNGDSIFEYPEDVSFELGKTEKRLRWTDFTNLLVTQWHNDSLSDFVNANGYEAFFANSVAKDFALPDGTIINKGMKIIKAFKFFESNAAALEDMQNAASRIIQEDKISGRLCVSVDPRDFLSASENTHNWRSCHALDGDYRAGNLSYMLDNRTVICYLKSKGEPVQLPNFPDSVPWNSKKWRVLLFFSNDMLMLMAGRQYPFHSESSLDFISTKVLPQIDPSRWSDWYQKTLTEVSLPVASPINSGEVVNFYTDEYIPVGNSLIEKAELIKNGENSLQFNDLLNSSCYRPMWCYKIVDKTLSRYNWGMATKNTGFTSRKTRFIVGSKVPCVDCGKHLITHSDLMICDYCELDHGHSDNEDFCYCSCCGRRVLEEDCAWVFDDLVCNDCLQTECTECYQCGSYEFNDYVVFSRVLNHNLCRCCAELYTDEELENND